MVLNKKKKIHFIGIGGIGMSGIAIVLAEMGYRVSGSDLELGDLTRKIGRLGGEIFEGHKAGNLSKDVSLVVYSSAISNDNPEFAEARKRKIPVLHRSEILAELFNKKKGIAVTGTHGKTTTTSLISVMLEKCGLDPAIVVGGEIDLFNGNAKSGKGKYFVAEADESDGSFTNFKPFYSVITNVEMEHMDYYKTIDDVKSAYRSFARNLKRGGTLFYNKDDSHISEILQDFAAARKSFGFGKDADIYPVDIEMNGFSTSFRCMYMGKLLGRVNLKLPGKHNVMNALAVILVGLEIGLDFRDIVDSIKDFSGAKRRFQLRACNHEVMLIDDYAHHPTEIRAVLDACRSWKDKRLVVIFQPHRYSRTKFLADEFGKCFEKADKLILTDIYAASEKAIKDISVKNIYDRVKANGLRDVVMLKKEKIAQHIKQLKKEGDMIVVMGAGDIKKVADDLHRELIMESVTSEGLLTSFRKIVKGEVRPRESLARHSSFRIGGPADIWVEPRDASDLRRVLAFSRERNIPTFVIGNGSNLLVGDNGFRGIVINLGSALFKKIKIAGTRITVGGGYSLPKLVNVACGKGLGGLESMVGIPGTIGGAIYMNAGGYTNPIYRNIGDLVISLKVMDYSGKVKVLKKEEIPFSYRTSGLDSYIILEAVLGFQKSSSKTLLQSSYKFLNMKKEKQVLDMPSAGCVFKNPKDFQFTCGQMIDMLGLKGKRIGGAEVSEKHANFIINRDCASAKDVTALIDFVRERVMKNYDIPLELEIKVI